MVAVPPDRIPATATESAYLAAVTAMARLGDSRTSTVAYATFLRRWPYNLTAAIGLANGHYALGELAQSEAVLRSATERHPDSAAALNNLAQVLSDQGRNAEALARIDRAIALAGPFVTAARETRELILRRLKSGN